MQEVPAVPEIPGVPFVVVEALHAYPPRSYHTLDHVAACLTALDAARAAGSGAERSDLVEFALFLHDAVYDPTRPDNEAQSAEVADALGRAIGLSAADRTEVRALIVATRHDRPGATPDERLIADVDLSVLGADEATYDAYRRGIEREFAFAGPEAYRQGRAAFLQAMLGRQRIFQMAYFHQRFDAAARENLARELAALE